MKNFLENQVDKLISHINKKNLGFGWKNNANRNHQGTYIDGECFDYIILHKNGHLCFDAKETNKDKWQVRKKDIKQGLNLLKAKKTGVQAFFLIYFSTEKKLVKINVDKFWNIIETRKHIKISDCEVWNYKELLRIN